MLRGVPLYFGIAIGAAACNSPASPVPPAPPSPPSLTRTDDFERPDGPPGVNWAWQGGGIGAPTLRAGRLGSTDANLVITWWVPDSFGPDQFSEVVIAPGFDPVTTKAIQVFVRRQAAGVPWRYGFHYDPTRGDYELKYDGGPGVIIARRPGSHFVPGDVVRIEVRGTTLSGFLNGVLILSTTHTALADGLTGVAINPLDDPALYAFESWRGGKLAGLEPSASALRRIR